MSPPSLYRRHRPRTFSDVVGQEAVVRTLRNAIERGAVHHAYLFVGSRGTGKTSMAKILAAALNCENGPTTDPCGTCPACEAIANSTSLDVIEMDAASNNSVDDIRELRERVALAPVTGSHKVYILDEAHMLSAAAWNAFLKTLEEPPPNTVFVLATTEAHKVLATVADRCHRFDFQRPTALEVGEVVTRVASSEGVDAPPEVLKLIARSADGSFRDALGTLEQLVTYAGEGGTLSADDALAVLGVVDSELRFEAIDAVCDGDPAAAVRAAARIASSGRDLRRFLDDLEAHGRALLLVDLAGEVPPELSVTEESDRRLADQSRRLGRAGSIRLLDLIAEAFAAIADGADPRLRLELLLVKGAEAPVPGRAAAAPQARQEARQPAADPPRQDAGGSGGAPGGPSARVVPAPSGAGAAAAASLRVVEPEPSPASESVVESAPVVEAVPSPAGAAEPAAETSAVPTDSGDAASTDEVDQAPEPVDGESGPGRTPDTGGEMPDESAVVSAWPTVVDQLAADTPMIASLLVKAWPLRVDGRSVTIAFPTSAEFHCRKAQDQRCKDAIRDAFAAVIGVAPELTFEMTDGESPIEIESERPLDDSELADILVREFGAVESRPEHDGPD